MLVFAAIYLVLLSNGGVLNYLTVAVDSVPVGSEASGLDILYGVAVQVMEVLEKS